MSRGIGRSGNLGVPPGSAGPAPTSADTCWGSIEGVERLPATRILNTNSLLAIASNTKTILKASLKHPCRCWHGASLSTLDIAHLLSRTKHSSIAFLTPEEPKTRRGQHGLQIAADFFQLGRRLLLDHFRIHIHITYTYTYKNRH